MIVLEILNAKVAKTFDIIVDEKLDPNLFLFIGFMHDLQLASIVFLHSCTTAYVIMFFEFNFCVTMVLN